MRIIEIKESELKNITQFLIDKKVILHPKISPEGAPDFTGYHGKRFIVILDQNILIRILRLVNNGELKDEHSLRIVSNVFVWANFNNIVLNSGLALTEYSHHHGGNNESSKKNNIFLQIHKQYSPKHWLDLATGKTKTIPKIELQNEKDFSFFVEDDHFKMHYLEMLKLAQLYFNNVLTISEKFEQFHKWVFSNILICKYTTYFAALVLGNKSKTFRNVEKDFELIIQKCRNAAWDLTYLSFWSTQYYFEDSASEVYLFATMDNELRELFFLTHKERMDIYIIIFGVKTGQKIIDTISGIYIKRDKPKIDVQKLDKMITEEQSNLMKVLKNNMLSNIA